MDPQPHPPLPAGDARAGEGDDRRLSERMQEWLEGGDTSLGSLIALFGEKSFAVVFVLLMSVPALPLPTGGATHVFELIAVLVALQLVAGRSTVWIPERWRALRVAGDGEGRFVNALLKLIRLLERISRPRLRFLFGTRMTDRVFGLLTIGLCVGAFVAPPFTGLDTLPALGVVVISLGMLLEDALIVAAGLVLGAVGIGLEIVLGKAAIGAVGRFL